MKNVWNKQHGGSHYKKYKIQPSKFVVENKLLYPEGCAIKYIIRHLITIFWFILFWMNQKKIQIKL